VSRWSIIVLPRRHDEGAAGALRMKGNLEEDGRLAEQAGTSRITFDFGAAMLVVCFGLY
jgi:hypothetical protein